MKGIIYKATNTTNGKVYIGQTSRTLEERRKEHESIAKETTWKTEGFFYGAIALFGIDKFSWEVLETVETDGNETDLHYLLLEAERQQIAAHKSYDRRFGYNIIGNPDGYLADMYRATHGNPKGPIVAYDIFSAKKVGEYPSMIQLRLDLGTYLVPLKVGGIHFCGEADFLAADEQIVTLDCHITLESTMN